jgi:O-antigen ligase
LIHEGFEKIGLQVSNSHFHNGFLNAWVEAGIFGMISLAAVFVVAASLAVRTLAAPSSAETRLGAIILVSLVITYLVNGLTGMLVGHDILDAMLMAFLVVGAYLAAGTSVLREGAS